MANKEWPVSKCFHCEAENDANSSLLICEFCHAFLYAELTQLDGDSGDSGNEDIDSVGSDATSNILDEISDQSARHEQDFLLKQLSMYQVYPVNSNFSHNGKLNELDSLPNEVLQTIFTYLDDLSKWACSKVNSRWKGVVNNMHVDGDWKNFIAKRWPLFNPQYRVLSYRELYSRLIEVCILYVTLFVNETFVLISVIILLSLPGIQSR